MECIYNKNEFCTNDQCPMCADYCPVPDTEGICKYEEREDEKWALTPKGCFTVALRSNGVHLDDNTINAVWDDFEAGMTRCGWVVE
jgi:hypothetical protein